MSEHRHRRRRRTSGFDLPRLYEDDEHSLDEPVREQLAGVVGWAFAAAAALFSLILVWIVMSLPVPANGGRSSSADLWATPPAGTAYVHYPPGSGVEDLTAPGSSVLLLLLLVGVLIISGIHLASGHGESVGQSGSDLNDGPAPEAAVPEPSAFQRRLDEMVCIKMSRRPQSRRHPRHC